MTCSKNELSNSEILEWSIKLKNTQFIATYIKCNQNGTVKIVVNSITLAGNSISKEMKPSQTS